MSVFEVFVEGEPVPQGSSTAFPVNGRCVVTAANNSKLKPWRDAVTRAVTDEMDRRRESLEVHDLAHKDAALRVGLRCFLPKPPSVRREDPTVRPDLDKLTRAVLDGVSDAGLWRDDANVVELHVSKEYAVAGLRPGVSVQVMRL